MLRKEHARAGAVPVSYTHLDVYKRQPFESHKDRHEKIGEGSLGLAAFERIVTHPALAGLPFYLETPNELDGYAKEIALLRGFAK